MATCFDRLIALKGGCSEVTLQSGGLYLNQIGIDRSFIESILNSDASGVDSFVSEQRTLASSLLKNDVFSHFTGKFNPKSIIEGQRVGFFSENMSLNSGIAGTAKGLQTRIWNETTFMTMFVSEMSLLINFTGTVNVLVYDLMSNTLLDTIPITTIAGQIATSTINKVYSNPSRELNLAFIYDSTGIGSFQTYLTQNYGGCITCTGYRGWRGNKYVWANGITVLNADAKIQQNLNTTAETGGLSVVYSLQCDHDKWLCSNANFLAPSILYKMGYLMMDQAIMYSRQMNSETLDVPKLEKRKEYYDFEYNKSIDAALKNLRIPDGDVCFVCNRVRMIKTIEPA